MKKIVILGYGGHAKSVVDSILSGGYFRIAGYTDICKSSDDFPYLGTDDELANIFDTGINCAAMGIGYMGNSKLRDMLVHKAIEIGFEFPPIMDPSATISSSAQIGKGCFIGKQTAINAYANIGEFCIVNTGAIVEHDNKIEDHSHIAVGAVLCGGVSVKHHTLIGAGSTVIQGRSIGSNCIIGAGSIVLSDVESGSTVYGIVNEKKGDLHG